MTSIFRSYARGDDGEPFDRATSFVARLHRELKAAGFDVSFDRQDMPSRSLIFHQEIRHAIPARERLLLVIGPKGVTSDYVRQEWQFAWRKADKVIYPGPIPGRVGCQKTLPRVAGSTLPACPPSLAGYLGVRGLPRLLPAAGATAPPR